MMLFFPQIGHGDKNRPPSEEVQESINPDQHEINIADGGEFLDDALRMKEQPLGDTTRKDNNSPS